MKPLKGRLEILIPNGGLNDHRSPGEHDETIFISPLTMSSVIPVKTTLITKEERIHSPNDAVSLYNGPSRLVNYSYISSF